MSSIHSIPSYFAQIEGKDNKGIEWNGMECDPSVPLIHPTCPFHPILKYPNNGT